MPVKPIYIDVDLKKKTQFALPTVTQNDTDTIFVLRLTDNGHSDPNLLMDFEAITLTSERKDKQAFYVAGTKDTTNNEVRFELGTRELEHTGKVTASVQFYSRDGRKSSAHFHYNVERDLSGNYEPTETEVTLIETVLVDGPARIAAAIDATEDAIEATAFADQTRLATESVRLSTVEARDSANDAAALANTAAETADTMATSAEQAAALATQEANDARAQKEIVEQVIADGPVASVNGQTGMITGLATEESVNQVTVKLAENGHDFTLLGKDGIVDDAPALNAIINQAVSKGVTKIVLPKATYRINSPLYAIEKDNLEIDFNGSDLRSYAKAANGSSLGIINLRGKMQSVDLLTYLRSHLVTQLIPSDAPVLNTYETHVSKANANTVHYGGRITTSNNAYFAVGDDILVRGWTRSSGTNYNKDLYEPMMTVVAKVLKIEGGYVYIDYFNPFGNLNFNQGTMKSFCAKLTFAKNLKIKNVNIYDMTTVETTDGVNPTTNDRNEALTPIMVLGCENVEIENVKMFNFKGNGVRFWFSRNIKEWNIEGHFPQLWDGGFGYTTQFNGSRDIYAENIYGVENRHVIDFSFSCHGHVKNLKSLNGRFQDIDMHGQNEHDITWENVEGTVAFGNGIVYYPMMLKNINFIKSKVIMPDLGNYAVRDDYWGENISFDDCDVEFKHFMPFQSVEYKKSRLRWNSLEVSIIPNKRGKSIETKSRIIDSEVVVDLSGILYTGLYLNRHDISEFVRTNFARIGGSPTTNYTFITSGSRNVLFKDTFTNDFFIRMQCIGGGDFKIHIDNCRSSLKNAANALVRIEGATGKVDVVYERSDLAHTGTVPIFYLISSDTASMTNANIRTIVRDNILKGNPNAKIRSTHNVSEGKITTNNLYDSNNIIEHYEVNASNHLSTTRNFIVT